MTGTETVIEIDEFWEGVIIEEVIDRSQSVRNFGRVEIELSE